MSILSWNCRELGNPATVRVLVDLVHSKKPNLVFLIETLMGNNKLQPIKNKLGYDSMFVVENVGRSGGLALLWKNESEVDIRGFSKHHIDAEIRLDADDNKWRFTGFYGVPERQRRSESWNLLKYLSTLNPLPWVVMGDFNDMLEIKEKRGGNRQPNWLLTGFKDAVQSSGLIDLRLEGHQFTWEKSRGTSNWVEEKLDRILVSESWLNLFGEARGTTLEATQSDHLPIILHVEATNRYNVTSRFKFENLWLQEQY